MAQIPHELIRQVQIRTRAAAGLLNYDPLDPSLPALPPLSATIAAFDPSAADHRCRNCKAMLLRGSESIICLYCGLGPHFDAVPDPISFTSTVGYRCLLRSLRLDGSEMVDSSNKSKQDERQNSPTDLTPLSVYLNYKIPWPVETVSEDISSDKHLEESKRSFVLPGVAPDRFFLKSKSNSTPHTPIEQPSDHKWVEDAGPKEAAALGNQDLFQNVQSFETAVSSSEDKNTEDLSGWDADFQFADSEDQLGGHASEGTDIKFKDPESFQASSGLTVDLAAHLDSVFGPGENLDETKPEASLSVPSDLGNLNSDDMWNTLTSSAPNVSDGFDATFSSKIDPQNDHTLGHSKGLSASDDIFQDFMLQTNCEDTTKNKTGNEEHTTIDEYVFDDWNDFASSTSVQAPSQNALGGSNDTVSTSENRPSEIDFFGFDNKNEGDKKSSDMDLFSFDNKHEGDSNKSSYMDLFSFSNKVEDDKKSSDRDLFSFNNKFEDDKKPSERDLFSFDSDFGGDFSSSPSTNLFSSSTIINNPPAESNAIMSENTASDWSIDALQSEQAANTGDAFGQSAKDDVKKLLSQIHDLSFMLETDLSLPSTSDNQKSVQKE